MFKTGGVLRKRFIGTPELASQFVPRATVLLNQLKSWLGDTAAGVYRQKTPENVAITVTTNPHKIDTLTIDISGANFCQLFKKPLKGLACIPHNQVSLRDLETTYYTFKDPLVFPRRSVVVLNPKKDPSTHKVKYTPYIFKKQFPSSTPAGFKSRAHPYAYRFDTCGNEIPWRKYGVFAGNINWRGPKGVVLSWFGSPCRYLDGRDCVVVNGPVSVQTLPGGGSYSYISTPHDASTSYTTPFNNSDGHDAAYGSLFYRGEEVNVSGAVTNVAGTLTRVSGACICKSSSGVSYLVLVMAYQPQRASNSHLTAPVVTEEVWMTKVAVSVDDIRPDKNFFKVATFSWTSVGAPYSYNQTPWLFNESGTQGVTNRTFDGIYRVFMNINVDTLTATIVQDVRALQYTSSLVPGDKTVSTQGSITYPPCQPQPPSGGMLTTQTVFYDTSEVANYSFSDSLDFLFGDYSGDLFLDMRVSMYGEYSADSNLTATTTLTSCSDQGDAGQHLDISRTFQAHRTAMQGMQVSINSAVVFQSPVRTSTETTTYDDTQPYTSAYHKTTTYDGDMFRAFFALDAREAVVGIETERQGLFVSRASATVYEAAPLKPTADPVITGPNDYLSQSGISTPELRIVSYGTSAVQRPPNLHDASFSTSPLLRFTSGAHFGCATTPDAVILSLPTFVVDKDGIWQNGNNDPLNYLTDSDIPTETGFVGAGPRFSGVFTL